MCVIITKRIDTYAPLLPTELHLCVANQYWIFNSAVNMFSDIEKDKINVNFWEHLAITFDT